jgi:hypothetical protein
VALVIINLFMITKYCIFLLLCLSLVGCDPVYPPVILNEYADSIEMSVSFMNDVPAQTGLKLPPKTEFIQRHKGLVIKEITVKEPSGNLRLYRQADFEDARAKQKVDFEVWILSEQGLKLGNKDDLKKFRLEKH